MNLITKYVKRGGYKMIRVIVPTFQSSYLNYVVLLVYYDSVIYLYNSYPYS
jgi:hypothetical protein